MTLHISSSSSSNIRFTILCSYTYAKYVSIAKFHEPAHKRLVNDRLGDQDTHLAERHPANTKFDNINTNNTHVYTYMATLIRRALDPERIRQPTSQLITFSMQPINPSTTQPIDASMKVSLSQCTLTHRFVPSTHTHLCVENIIITLHCWA